MNFSENWQNYLNEALLAEGRLEDAKDRYPELNKLGYIDKMASEDPTNNNAYLGWMAKRLNDFFSLTQGAGEEQSSMREEHVEDIIGITKQFHQNKQRLQKKDIYQYKAYEDLKDAIDALGQTRSQKRKFEKEQAMEGSEIIFEDENFFAIRPFTRQASCHYGAKSKWCISARGNGYFDQYTSEGKGFVFVRMNNMVSSSDQEREFALVFDRDGDLESTFDIEDVEGDDEAFHDAAAVNILEGIFSGTKYAGQGREMYGEIYSDMNTAMEDKPAPGIYKAIAKEIEKQYGDSGAIADPIDIDEAELYELSDWIVSSIRAPGYEIIGMGRDSIESQPPGPSVEALDEIVSNFNGEARYSHLDYEMYDNLHFQGGMSIELTDFPLSEWSEKVQDEYDDYRSETEDKLKEILSSALDSGGIYPDNMDISWERQWNRETGSYATEEGSEVLTVRMDFYQEYEESSVRGFQEYADRILEYDANVDNVKERLANAFMEALMIKSDAYTSIEQIKSNALADLENFDEADVGDGEVTFYGTLRIQTERVPAFLQEISQMAGTENKPGPLAWFREKITGPFRDRDETIMKFYFQQAHRQLDDLELNRNWRMKFGQMLNKVYDSQEEMAKRQGKLDLQEENLYQAANFEFNIVKNQRIYHPESGKMSITFYIEIPIRDNSIDTGLKFIKDVDRLWSSVEEVYEKAVTEHMYEIYAGWEDDAKAKLEVAMEERKKEAAASETPKEEPMTESKKNMQSHFDGWRRYIS